MANLRPFFGIRLNEISRLIEVKEKLGMGIGCRGWRLNSDGMSKQHAIL